IRGDLRGAGRSPLSALSILAGAGAGRRHLRLHVEEQRYVLALAHRDQLTRDRLALHERLEQTGLYRRVLVAPAQDVDPLLVASEHERDVARRGLGLDNVRLLAHVLIVPRWTAKR